MKIPRIFGKYWQLGKDERGYYFAWDRMGYNEETYAFFFLMRARTMAKLLKRIEGEEKELRQRTKGGNYL